MIEYVEEHHLEFGGMKQIYRRFECPDCKRQTYTAEELCAKICEVVKIHKGINNPNFNENKLRNSLSDIVATFGYELK